uniref:Chromo domain-containing protein n=1 Tax=Panagrolaimus sp. PS1159 TaxID=55785 RepID=A0AC35FY62_9BILA
MSDDEEAVSVENEYVVEKILDKRGSGKKVEYLIKWRGYDDPAENTWEPINNCDCPDLIKEFEAAYAKKQKSKEKLKETRGSRANTKSVEPDGKHDRKRKAIIEPPQPIRKKKPSPPKTRIRGDPSKSSDSNSDRPTTSIKKVENGDDDVRPQDSSTPQQTVIKEVKPVAPRFTPADDLPPLDFIAKEIVGISGKPPDRQYVVVRTKNNALKAAEIKAVAKQNLDVCFKTFISLL